MTMKIAGLVFVICASSWTGFRMANALRSKCQMIEQLLTAMQILYQEIVVCATPLPQAFAIVSVSSKGDIRLLFSEISKRLDQTRWLTPCAAMTACLDTIPSLINETEICDLLINFASAIGKYDRDAQKITIDQSKIRLETMRMQAEQNRSMKSKSYKVLGICTGLSVAILLL